MVNIIFIDLQRFKYYNLLSKLPIKTKRSEMIFRKYLVENIKFLKTIHRNELARKENTYLFSSVIFFKSTLMQILN